MSGVFDLQGRVAVVAGGTSGLGQALARGLGCYGATVIAAGRRSKDAPLDVTSKSSVEELRDLVLGEFGRVDILVNAAGVTRKEPTIDVTDEAWNGLFDSNVAGMLRTCRAFYPALKASGHGRIINIASLGSYLAFHQVSAYCASKAAVLSLTRSLACEWARDRVIVNAIAPGVFPTDLNRSLLEGTERGREILVRTPMARFGEADELVGVAVMLASDAATFLTGQCIAVDGGFLASGVNS